MEWIDVNADDSIPRMEPVVVLLSNMGTLCCKLDFRGEWEFPKHAEEYVKNLEITHWAPLPPPPKKKRWKPGNFENFFFICSSKDGPLVSECTKSNPEDSSDMIYINTLGAYKTKEDAEAMAIKIKAFVTAEIGEP